MHGDHPGQRPPHDDDIPDPAAGGSPPGADRDRGDHAQRLYQMKLRAEERRLREEERQQAIARRNEIIRRVKRGCFYLIGALEILLGMPQCRRLRNMCCVAVKR